MVRNDYLAKVGDKAAFQALIDAVTAKLTTDELTKLGVAIQVNHKDIRRSRHPVAKGQRPAPVGR